jgi:hypothetical protein
MRIDATGKRVPDTDAMLIAKIFSLFAKVGIALAHNAHELDGTHNSNLAESDHSHAKADIESKNRPVEITMN